MAPSIQCKALIILAATPLAGVALRLGPARVMLDGLTVGPAGGIGRHTCRRGWVTEEDPIGAVRGMVAANANHGANFPDDILAPARCPVMRQHKRRAGLEGLPGGALADRPGGWPIPFETPRFGSWQPSGLLLGYRSR